MEREREEANLMGQVAGMLAVMRVVVQALPPTTRKRLPQLLDKQFENLIAAMRRTGTIEGEDGREGAEWVRDLFLRDIGRADKKPRKNRISSPAGDALDIQL